MSARLAEITARMESVRKLGAVVAAIRGMAAARARQAEAELAAVDSYEATIRSALARVLAMLPEPGAGPAEPDTLVIFLAEQGFAGAFSERLLDHLGEVPRLVLIGTRGRSVAAERGLTPDLFHPLPTHGPAVPRFADELARDLLAGGSHRIDALFTASGPGGSAEIRSLRLFPVEASPGDRTALPPLLNLAPAELLAGLMGEALHAGLCRAALHALAAENAARMQAMTSAQTQTERKLAELVALERQVRQETITDEIVELAAGEAAVRGSLRRAATARRTASGQTG